MMHEMALAEGILGVALDVAKGQQIRRIQVRAGVLQRVVPDSLQLCFEMASQGTSAAEAVLDLTEIALRLRCARCGAEGETAIPIFLCRGCGADTVEVMAGEELLVDAVELDSGWLHRPGSA